MDKRLIWLAVGSFTISTEGFVISSLLPDIARDAGITVPVAGMLITAFALAYALGTPVLATLTGDWDRRRVILSTLAFFVLGNIVAALSSSFSVLLVARVIMALSSGLFAATAQATAVALVDDHHRARAIAIVVGGTLGAIAAFRQNSAVDYVVTGMGALGLTIPNFVVAPIFQIVFGLALAWLPVAGWNNGSPRNLILPVLVLALPQVAVDEPAMRALAKRRADAVRSWLTGKLDAARYDEKPVLLDAKGIDDKGKTTRVDFGLHQ